MDQSPAAAAIRVAVKLIVGKWALISAVSAGVTEFVANLLDGGVPIDTKDDEGMSLLHLGAGAGHVTTMRLLIRRGCDVDSVDSRELTPLHCAAAMGQTKAVRELIRKGASKSVVAGKNGTPLHQAVLYGHVKTAVAMLEEGCPLDVVSGAGATPLHFAAIGGCVELVRELIDRKCNINAEANGCTPLHCAAGCGRTEAVCELIKLGAAMSVVAGNLGTPLHVAAFSGQVETAVAMLEKGCPLDVVSGAGASVLHAASKGGNVDLVRELVSRGCDVNAVEANGCTPLHSAAGHGRTEAIRELIKLGAAMSVVADNLGTPLHLATLKGHVETAVAMLEEGCPLDAMHSNVATVLHLAATGGNVDLVRELVDRGSNVNAVVEHGWTPLHCAAGFGRTEAVRELIKLGAAKSVVAGDHSTPLHLAALNGHVETAVAMLEEGCPLDVMHSNVATILHYAAAGGNVELVRELVDRGCDVNAVNAKGCTPLHDAAGLGRTEAVRELIKLGAAKSVVAGTHGTPLHQAAYCGHMETAVAMLEEGCPLDVDLVSSDGGTVLHFAASGGNVELGKMFVVGGCDVNAVKANGCTPLHSAAAHGRTEAVRELIKLGAAKSVIDGNHGTPLHQAAIGGHVDIAVAMLEQGCPLGILNCDGATVLHFAAVGGNVELVRELVGRGCDVNAVEASGCTPLHSAAGCGRTEAVRELIKLGAAKSVVAGKFGTPLHQAAIGGHVETAVAMLEEGCPLDVVSGAGATVLHSAAEGGNVELVRDLVGRGCDVNAVKVNGCTPLHSAAGRGRTEAVCELIKLGATKSVVAGRYGTPLHQAIVAGHVKTVEAILEDALSEPDLASHVVIPSKGQVLDSGIIGVCDSLGQSPVFYAVEYGQVEMLKLLVSKGGAISERDTHSLSAFEACFVGGQASKLSQFCEASGIRSSGGGLRGALATLIIQGLVDAHKVLCLCAISGDSVFLEDQFIELVASDACTMPAAVKYAKRCFYKGEGVPFINQLRIPDENALNPLQMALLSLKCYEMGFAIGSLQRGAKDHTSFITKLLSHPVLKKTVHENFPNGLSPLDLARQFELHHIAALIEGAGGRPGVWAEIPRDEVKLLVSSGSISDRDQRLLCALEHCFVGGQASKLLQFCEASGIRSSGEGLRGVLTTLITQGLAEAHKVLCLCAVSGDSIFLDDTFIELVASDACAMPAAVNCVKYCFQRGEGGSFIDQLKIPGEISLNPLHMALLSLKCYEMGFAIHAVQCGVKDHTSFITKLLSHSVLKETVRENFPNGLSPLDLARQFELPHIAALIEGAGGRPGVWAGVRQEIEVRHPLALSQVKEAYASIKAIAEDGEHGLEFIKGVFSSILGAQTMESAVQVADDSRLVKEQVLGQCPDLGDVVTHVLPHIQMRSKWKSIGLTLGIKKRTLDQFSNDDDPYLETLSYWLEHGSSVTWKTLLDGLGHFETKHTVDELTDKIVSVLGGGDQVVAVSGAFRPVSSSALVVSRGAVAAERSPHVCEGLTKYGPLKPLSSSSLAVSVELSSPVQTLEEGRALSEHPLVKATPVQVVQDHAVEFLEKMNSKVLAPQLKVLGLIPESVECDIRQSKSRKEANVYLLNHLKEDADEESVREVFRIASEKTGYGKMKVFAAGVLRELQ